jgi:hypothetical protein
MRQRPGRRRGLPSFSTRRWRLEQDALAALVFGDAPLLGEAGNEHQTSAGLVVGRSHN